MTTTWLFLIVSRDSWSVDDLQLYLLLLLEGSTYKKKTRDIWLMVKISLERDDVITDDRCLLGCGEGWGSGALRVTGEELGGNARPTVDGGCTRFRLARKQVHLQVVVLHETLLLQRRQQRLVPVRWRHFAPVIADVIQRRRIRAFRTYKNKQKLRCEKS